MTVPAWPDKVIPPINYALADLMECVCDALANLGQGPVCECVIVGGELATADWAGECASGRCGMAYIRPGLVSPYDIFPFENVDPNCYQPLAYQLDVGVFRCYPVAGEDLEPPEAELTTEATLLLMEDQAAILTALRCCDSPYLGYKAVGSWQPTGPSGASHGGFWTFYVDPVG